MPAEATNTPVIFRAYSGRVYRSAPKAGPVGAVLTYPLTDYAGDYVQPGGGDWSDAPQYSGVEDRCRVNWTHDIPVGLGQVSTKSLAYKGQTHAVDYGQTTFFQSAKDLAGVDLTRREPGSYRPIGTYQAKAVLTAAEQVERLVRDDVATGVSVEFRANGPKGVAWNELDTFSELEQRPCLHYKAWSGLAYAHAIQPINPGARTVLTSAPEHLEKAIKIAVDGTLGGKPLSDVVLKAFRPLKQWARPDGRVTVAVRSNVGSKAMEDEMDFDTPPGGTVEMDEETPPVEQPEAGPTPAVRTMLEGAQMLLDLADQLEAGIGQSEHKKARKYVGKIIAELQATADEMNAMAETVRADLEGDMAEADEEAAEGEDELADEPPVEDASDLDHTIEEKAIVPLKRDKDGFIIIKSFPNWKPRRFHLSELKDAPSEQVSPAEVKAVMAELAREQRKARPFLRALRANQS